MTYLRFSGLFTGKNWIEPAYVCLDTEGKIQKISEYPISEDSRPVVIDGFAIPGFQNCHSHAFQYAMAGLAEHLPADRKSDDFWSWRETMYHLAQNLTPDQFRVIATAVYSEMLRNGITAVAEFHYLHHDISGKPYKNCAEMAIQLMEAAQFVGIQLTLIPIFYQLGGFGEAPRFTQRRFISNNCDDYARILEASRTAASKYPDAIVGIGVHSLRAARPEDIKKVFNLDPETIAHIHVAEQRREVVDCIKHLGTRPIAWLLNEIEINSRFALIHATHSDPGELDRLAKAGATVVICPSTEANLGDGLFNLVHYRSAGGRLAIGTDSHIGLNPMEELRWLDYCQRAQRYQRNILCEPGQDSGEIAFMETWQNGRLALGRDIQDNTGTAFAVGIPFDAAIIDAHHPLIVSKPRSRRLSAIVYGGDPSIFRGVMRNGRWLVEYGIHKLSSTIRRQFTDALATIS